jgi:hypothetical protein
MLDQNAMITFKLRYDIAREVRDALVKHTLGTAAASPLGVLRYEIAAACDEVSAEEDRREAYWDGVESMSDD